MRFRGDVSCVAALERIVKAIATVAPKQVILKLAPDELGFICEGSSALEAGTSLWTKLPVEAAFDQWKVESNANNEIYLSVNTQALAHAIKSTTGSVSIIIRLAKRGPQAVLNLAISSVSKASLHGRQLEISQDVTAKVLAPKDFAEIKPPTCPSPDVSIMMPPTTQLRNVVEKMSKMGATTLFMSGSNDERCLKLRVESDMASVETEWKDLTLGSSIAEPTQETMPSFSNRLPGVNIDAKSFAKLLRGVESAKTIMLFLCDKHCAVLFATMSVETQGTLVFFVPHVHRDGD